MMLLPLHHDAAALLALALMALSTGG